MQTVIILKNSGHKYNGRYLSETETELVIDDVKLGPITIKKEEIAVRGDRQWLLKKVKYSNEESI